jgi:hypothetical protein
MTIKHRTDLETATIKDQLISARSYNISSAMANTIRITTLADLIEHNVARVLWNQLI